MDERNLYMPIGPLPWAETLLKDKYGVNSDNLLDKADEYLNQLTSIDDLNNDDFRAFFWAVSREKKNDFYSWLPQHGYDVEAILKAGNSFVSSNSGVATLLFFMYRIKGFVFPLDLITVGLDVSKMDLTDTFEKELFDDLQTIFTFILDPLSGQLYLPEQEPTIHDLKNAIKKWQEAPETQSFLLALDENIPIPCDGIFRETDKICLYNELVVFLMLVLEISEEMFLEEEGEN